MHDTPKPHPSGLPDAPWTVDADGATVIGASGKAVLIADVDAERPDDEAELIARAARALPELIVQAGRLAAANVALEETQPSTEDGRQAYRTWCEVSVEAVRKIESLLGIAGLPIPTFPGPVAALSADANEPLLALNPGGSA